MDKKKEIVLVNFWGLGDLVATLKFIKNNNNFNYYIITPHNHSIIQNLISSININTFVSICRYENKIMLVTDIIKNIFLRKTIIFTAPLSGKSRKLAKFLSYFSKKITLAKEKGNFYLINDNIKINY